MSTTNGPIDIVMDRGSSGFDDPGYRSRCPGYVNELLEEVDRLSRDRKHFAEAVNDRNKQIDRLSRQHDAYARAKAENDERFQLEAGEQRQRAEFYAGVLDAIRTMIGAREENEILVAIYNKAAWALDGDPYHPRG